MTPWAIKDGCDTSVGHLTNVINSFISEKKFPNNFKTTYVTTLLTKMILITLKAIGLSQLQLLCLKFSENCCKNKP